MLPFIDEIKRLDSTKAKPAFETDFRAVTAKIKRIISRGSAAALNELLVDLLNRKIRVPVPPVEILSRIRVVDMPDLADGQALSRVLGQRTSPVAAVDLSTFAPDAVVACLTMWLLSRVAVPRIPLIIPVVDLTLSDDE